MKKKTLAKSYPKNLIKELCRREAGKSEVTIGNMRSVLKHLADIIGTPEDDDALTLQFLDYIAARAHKKYGQKVDIGLDLRWNKCHLEALDKHNEFKRKKAKAGRK